MKIDYETMRAADELYNNLCAVLSMSEMDEDTPTIDRIRKSAHEALRVYEKTKKGK